MTKSKEDQMDDVRGPRENREIELPEDPNTIKPSETKPPKK